MSGPERSDPRRDDDADWFTISYPDPFMIKVYPIRPEKRAAIPAVTHVDGTGRLQTVSRSANLPYWTLIEAFRRETGVPVVLNTSFNLHGEPIVCTPTDAVDTFERSGLPHMALGHFLISKR